MTKPSKREKHISASRNVPAQNYWVWGVLLAIILLTVAIRVRLLDAPLERDEGEYAYAGQLLLQGVPPFAEAYNMKMPGIYIAYAAVMTVFGQTVSGVHLGLLLINAATITFMFLLGRRLVDDRAGLVAATAYAAMTLSVGILGPYAHATHFVTFFMVPGVFLLLQGLEKGRWYWFFSAGLLLGLAFLMKQHAAPVILFSGLYLAGVLFARKPFCWRMLLSACALFSVGVFVPYCLMCLWLWKAGVFGTFWFWTMDYASEYVSILSFRDGWTSLLYTLRSLVPPVAPFWVLALVGIVASWWNREDLKRSFFVTFWFVASFLAVCPGLYFRQHYFVVLMPALALLAGSGVAALAVATQKKWGHAAAAGLTLAAIGIGYGYLLAKEQVLLLRFPPSMVTRAIYGANPFPESVAISEYIREHSSPSDKVAVLGSEPQIYFYSQRRAATGYMYMYPLMEPHPFALTMQQNLIRQVESAHPRYLVYVRVSTSWLARPKSHNELFNWMGKYVDSHYRRVGLVEISNQNATRYVWGARAEAAAIPTGGAWVAVYERRDS